MPYRRSTLLNYLTGRQVGADGSAPTSSGENHIGDDGKAELPSPYKMVGGDDDGEGGEDGDERVVLFNCATGLKYPMPPVTRSLDRTGAIDYPTL